MDLLTSLFGKEESERIEIGGREVKRLINYLFGGRVCDRFSFSFLIIREIKIWELGHNLSESPKRT